MNYSSFPSIWVPVLITSTPKPIQGDLSLDAITTHGLLSFPEEADNPEATGIWLCVIPRTTLLRLECNCFIRRGFPVKSVLPGNGNLCGDIREMVKLKSCGSTIDVSCSGPCQLNRASVKSWEVCGETEAIILIWVHYLRGEVWN